MGLFHLQNRENQILEASAETRQSLHLTILTPGFPPDIGGIETFCKELSEVLYEKGYLMTVVTYSYQRIIYRSDAYGSNFRVLRLKSIRPGINVPIQLATYSTVFRVNPLGFFLRFIPLFLFSLIAVERSEKAFNIIDAQEIWCGLIARLLKIVKPQKIVYTSHDTISYPKSLLVRVIAKWLFWGFDHIFVLSQKSKVALQRLGIPNEGISVYRHWTHTNLFKPLEPKIVYRQLLAIPGNSLVVLYVGRLVPEKGVELIIELAKSLPEVFFLVIGGGPLEETFKSLRIANLRYAGQVTENELAVYYAISDLCIIPSVKGEVWPKVIVESLSCGTPILGSDDGFLPEAITSEVGFVVPYDYYQWRNLLSKISKNKGDLPEMSKKCRKVALEKFSERNAELFHKVFLRLLDSAMGSIALEDSEYG